MSSSNVEGTPVSHLVIAMEESLKYSQLELGQSWTDKRCQWSFEAVSRSITHTARPYVTLSVLGGTHYKFFAHSQYPLYICLL